jgi:hypothetical protein
MMGQIEVSNDLALLVSAGSRKYFQPHRRVFAIWGVAILVAGFGTEAMARLGVVRYIPALWLFLVASALTVSVAISRRIKRDTGVNPALLAYHVALWLGGTCCVLTLFLIGAIGAVYQLKYLPALSFPVIALCSLVSGTLFRSRAFYVASACFFLAAIPAVAFPERGALIQAILMGGGLIFLGARHG